jgi:hypothetical protein
MTNRAEKFLPFSSRHPARAHDSAISARYPRVVFDEVLNIRRAQTSIEKEVHSRARSFLPVTHCR